MLELADRKRYLRQKNKQTREADTVNVQNTLSLGFCLYIAAIVDAAYWPARCL